MTDKEQLRLQQPVAWKILSNALLSGRISHAYLFYGPPNILKSKMALLFAQSLVCPNPDEEGFACQSCSVCRQMEQEENPDFYWLHPKGLRRAKPLSRKEIEDWWKGRTQTREEPSWRIRKDDILSLQQSFAATAVTGMHQSYLVEGYDQATPAASNALLKFLEEPRENLCGILIADELSSVLPTIVSRCQLIPFRARPLQALEEELSEILEDRELVSILARAGYDASRLEELLEEGDLYELRAAAVSFWPLRHTHQALVDLQLGVFSKKRHPGKDGLAFFFQVLLWLLEQEPVLDPLRLEERLILLEALDSLRLPLDPALLLERTVFRLRKVSPGGTSGQEDLAFHQGRSV